MKEHDDDCYRSMVHLQELKKNSEDVEMLCLDFSVADGHGGYVELVEGGEDIDVTNENLNEYLVTSCKYRLLEQTKQQVTAILRGFHDIIPIQELLAVFPSCHDMEVLICGHDAIDVPLWKESTQYFGEFQELRERHPVCQWFWEYISSCDTINNEQRQAQQEQEQQQNRRVDDKTFAASYRDMKQSRVLQYVTGRRLLPSSVTHALRWYDEHRQLRFQLCGHSKGRISYPTAEYVSTKMSTFFFVLFFVFFHCSFCQTHKTSVY